MSDVETQGEDTLEPVVPEAGDDAELAPLPAPDERQMLMQKARLMGIAFSPNIGVETLRARIREKLEVDAQGATPAPVPAPTPAPSAERAERARTRTLRQHLLDENMRLVRLRITCLDPKKKDLPGEIITVANEYIGTVRKFVPFGEVTENGYHVPHCIYKLLKGRKFLNIKVIKSRDGNRDRVETTYVPEFALEVLPPLTPAELQKLATAQLAAGNS